MKLINEKLFDVIVSRIQSFRLFLKVYSVLLKRTEMKYELSVLA